jgi:gliding motility-associated-like protein
VNNAVAPHGSSPANSYLHINGLPEQNRVTIFNRWGDQVYEAHNYNNTSVRFVGQNDHGNDLASGTYFYKVEYNSETKTGYLTLKQ